MNDGKVCVSVCAERAVDIIHKIAAAEAVADVVEVRFDCLHPNEIDAVLSQITGGLSSKPILFTFRSFDQGGTRDLSLAERLNFWAKVLANPPAGAIIDVEAEAQIASAVKTNTIPRIVSHHDFNGVPEDLPVVFDVIATGFDADIVKIAVTANDITDTIGIWKLIEKAGEAGKKIIPIAMGEAGKWPRILGLAHGAFLTYSALGVGDETAPGQVTAKQMAELYRAKKLDRSTKVFGILGDPVSQSLSTFMHNPAFVSEGYNGVFIPFLVKDIDAFTTRMVRIESREIDLNFGGFSVTMPHKQSIMRHLDEIEPTAAKIGAVNTVKIRDDGSLLGLNTDAHGFITPLKDLFGDLKGSRAAVFGAGGAARACVYALQHEGCSVELFVRDVAKAQGFAEEFNVPVSQISNLKSEISKGVSVGNISYDLVIDTTPLGMPGAFENESLFSADELRGVKFVYDLVTKPYDTPIVREAKKVGIPAIGGLEMLVAQGAKQFEIWTGRKAPARQMKQSVLDRFAELNK